MLLPAEVVPFLTHEDSDVREHALEYLADGHDAAPATAEDVWAAADRHGDAPTRFGTDARVYFARRLPHFAPTPRSTERLLRELRAAAEPEVAWALVGAARELPPPAVRALVEDEAILARLPPATIADLHGDLQLAEQSFDALWAALSDAAVELGDDWTLSSPVFARTRGLLRAVARSPELAAARGLEVLGGTTPRSAAEANMELFAVELFGRVRYRGPLAPLLRILAEDGDYTNERAADALVRVGTPEVVTAVESRLPGPEAFLAYAPGVITRIRRPESEAALLRLLEAEADPFHRTELAMDLLDLCTTSPEALRLIERMVEDGDYDVQLVDLDELLVTVGKMVGWSPGDPAAWNAKPKLLRPMQALAPVLSRLAERTAAPPRPAGPERRGFVAYGKKARRRKGKKGR